MKFECLEDGGEGDPDWLKAGVIIERPPNKVMADLVAAGKIRVVRK
jgi:hypothetical protein